MTRISRGRAVTVNHEAGAAKWLLADGWFYVVGLEPPGFASEPPFLPDPAATLETARVPYPFMQG